MGSSIEDAVRSIQNTKPITTQIGEKIDNFLSLSDYHLKAMEIHYIGNNGLSHQLELDTSSSITLLSKNNWRK